MIRNMNIWGINSEVIFGIAKWVDNTNSVRDDYDEKWFFYFNFI